MDGRLCIIPDLSKEILEERREREVERSAEQDEDRKRHVKRYLLGHTRGVYEFAYSPRHHIVISAGFDSRVS